MKGLLRGPGSEGSARHGRAGSKGSEGGRLTGPPAPKVAAAFGGGLRSLALRGATALWAEGKVSPDGDEYEASVTGLPSRSRGQQSLYLLSSNFYLLTLIPVFPVPPALFQPLP